MAIGHRTILAGALLALSVGCVDLTLPESVQRWKDGSGGTQVPPITTEPLGGAGGSIGGGGTTGSGGIVGTGGSGAGGSGGAGGVPIDAALPDTASPADAPDVPGHGGSGAGGAGIDSGGLGGVTGTGGAGGKTTLPDAQAGGRTGTGGTTGTDPIPSTGGVVGTGGTPSPNGGTIGAGGATGTGGTTSSGGSTGTGGTTSSGGTTGTGGTTSTGGSTGLNCAAAIVPANASTAGVVTDFSDWNTTTARWGSSSGLNGTIFNYAGTNATMGTAKIEGTPKGLHLVGTVPSGSYAGAGLSFLSCVTVASFTKVQFNIYGSATNCAIELQLQTFDQRPTSQTPPGGCVTAADGSGCYKFPVKSAVVDLGTAVTTPKVVATTLSGMTNWTTGSAGQIVGVQWQLTRSGSADCAVDATISDVRFVP